jgi:hypothetical protein
VSFTTGNADQVAVLRLLGEMVRLIGMQQEIIVRLLEDAYPEVAPQTTDALQQANAEVVRQLTILFHDIERRQS